MLDDFFYPDIHIGRNFQKILPELLRNRSGEVYFHARFYTGLSSGVLWDILTRVIGDHRVKKRLVGVLTEKRRERSEKTVGLGFVVYVIQDFYAAHAVGVVEIFNDRCRQFFLQ